MDDQKRDQSVWVRETLDRYERPLVRYALRYAGDLESARDAVQDTFLKLCLADPAALNGKLAGWLFTVCRNRALDMRRKQRRSVPLEPGVEQQLPEIRNRDLAGGTGGGEGGGGRHGTDSHSKTSRQFSIPNSQFRPL